MKHSDPWLAPVCGFATNLRVCCSVCQQPPILLRSQEVNPAVLACPMSRVQCGWNSVYRIEFCKFFNQIIAWNGSIVI